MMLTTTQDISTTNIAFPKPVAGSAPGRGLRADLVPWVERRPGLAFKPLCFLRGGRGWSGLLRVAPGTVIPRHRHTGEIHAYHLQGTRKLDTGMLIGPGAYVYEPAGNVDSWSAVGDIDMIAHVTVYGAIEYLSEDDRVLATVTPAMQYDFYLQHCEAAGITPLDLIA